MAEAMLSHQSWKGCRFRLIWPGKICWSLQAVCLNHVLEFCHLWTVESSLQGDSSDQICYPQNSFKHERNKVCMTKDECGAHFEMMWKSAPHLNIVSKIRHSCLPHVNINLDPSPTCPHSCHMFLLQPQSSHHWPNLSRQRMPKSGEVYMCAWCATDPSPHHIWDSCLSTANMMVSNGMLV